MKLSNIKNKIINIFPKFSSTNLIGILDVTDKNSLYIERVAMVRRKLEDKDCPYCKKKGSLIMQSFLMADDEYESKILCTSCRARSTLNLSGMSWEFNVNKYLKEKE
jgi:hypothetical protein